MEQLLGIVRSTTGDEPKCTDCKRHKLLPADPVLIYSWPKHRCTAAIDIVTGNTIETDCYAMRDKRCECGPEAKLFEKASANEEKKTAAALSTVERAARKGLTALLAALIALAILALGVWVYEHETDPPRVIQTGKVSVKRVSAKDGSCCVTSRTQLLAIGNRSLWQFEASPGVWEDCGDDCEKALRRKLAK